MLVAWGGGGGRGGGMKRSVACVGRETGRNGAGIRRWLCFIDSGHQIKTRHTSLGFWFYFPKVLVCSSVWAALSAYAYFHDIPHNNADIRRYLDNSNFFVYLGVLLLVLYLSLVMMSCQRTRRLLQNV